MDALEIKQESVMDRARGESLIVPLAGFALVIGATIWMLMR